MAFSQPYEDFPTGTGAGEVSKYKSFDALPMATFESGLVAGRFCKLDTGSFDNVDGSATPTIAGVVMRVPENPIEDDDTYTDGLGRANTLSVVRNGYVTVTVKTGDTPAMFGTVYVDNTGAADYGKATTTAGGNVDVGAEFIEAVEGSTDVWWIRIR